MTFTSSSAGNSRRTPESAGQVARSEHRDIRAALAVIEILLRRLAEVEPCATCARRASTDLERLSSQLARHFVREEAPDGIFALALAEAPRLSRRVTTAQQQHEPLGAELGHIVVEARNAGLAPDAWREASKRFCTFAEALRDHEQEEAQILTAAYLDDVGCGD